VAVLTAVRVSITNDVVFVVHSYSDKQQNRMKAV
jgi:hypothetical protein